MAPIRRYIRISKFKVIECRIMLGNPELAESWLLHPQHPVLPRVFESIRPLLKAKLLEEEQKAKQKGKKSKKATKDEIKEDDFECLVFFKSSQSRYNLLSKQKSFKTDQLDKPKADRPSIPDGTNPHTEDMAIDSHSPPILIEEDSDEPSFDPIPPSRAPLQASAQTDSESPNLRGSRHKRQRPTDGSGPSPQTIDSDSDTSPQERIQPKVSRQANSRSEFPPQSDEKKKSGMTTSYDGFSIYGLTLYLVVTRTSGLPVDSSSSSDLNVGRKIMKNWIASTQQAPLDE